jgi:hypothetical protein
MANYDFITKKKYEAVKNNDWFLRKLTVVCYQICPHDHSLYNRIIGICFTPGKILSYFGAKPSIKFFVGREIWYEIKDGETNLCSSSLTKSMRTLCSELEKINYLKIKTERKKIRFNHEKQKR